MLLEKYRPKKIEDMVGNKAQSLEIEGFASKWEKGGLILHGPTGCGKTLTVRLIAKKLGMELVESHASDDRGIKGLETTLKKSLEQQSLLQKKKLILIEDVGSGGSLKTINELIKTGRFPIIMTTEDPYHPKMRTLKQKCTTISFPKVRSDSIAKFLKGIRDQEEITLNDNDITHIARISNGDVRAALNDLESGANGNEIGVRDNETDIFNTVKVLFKTRSIENIKTILRSSEKPPEDVLLWLEWNITQEYEDLNEIHTAFEWLSKADIFSARTLKSWSVVKYRNDLSFIGVALAKKEMYRKFVRYAFPRVFAKRDRSFSNISKKLHISESRVKEYMPLLKAMAKKKVLPEYIEEDLIKV
jgi:replication factor C large subunit